MAEIVIEGKEMKNHKRLIGIFFSLILFPHSFFYRAILILVTFYVKKRLVNPTDSTYPESAPDARASFKPAVNQNPCFSLKHASSYCTRFAPDVNHSLIYFPLLGLYHQEL